MEEIAENAEKPDEEAADDSAETSSDEEKAQGTEETETVPEEADLNVEDEAADDSAETSSDEEKAQGTEETETVPEEEADLNAEDEAADEISEEREETDEPAAEEASSDEPSLTFIDDIDAEESASGEASDGEAAAEETETENESAAEETETELYFDADEEIAEKEEKEESSGEEANDVESTKSELDKSLGGGLSNEKYDELFAKYLGGENKSGNSDFESLHELIIDRQGEEGSKSIPNDDTSESIKDAETFINEQPQTDEPEIEADADDEYFRMMKTEKITVKAETKEESDLEKEIKDAEIYVEENYKNNETSEKEEKIKNVDAFSTNPSIKKEKKSLFSSLFRKKSGELDEDMKFDDDYIDKLGSTDELIAYERASSTSIENGVIKKMEILDEGNEGKIITAEVDKPEVAETVQTEEKPSSDTAMMMMAFGYEPSKDDGGNKSDKGYDEYSFASTSELETTEELSDTAMLGTDTVQTNNTVTEMLDRPLFEYTDAEENKEIFGTFRKKHMSIRLRMFACAFIAAVLLVWEFILPIPALGVSIDSTVLIAVDWMLTVACALIVCDRLVIAVKNLFKGKFDADTTILFALLLSLATSITALVSYITFSYWGDIRLYNFSFAVFAFFDLLSASYLLNRDIYAFKVISSKKTKRVIARVGADERSREDVAFGEYLSSDSDVCKIKNAEFISDFFSNKDDTPKNRKPLKIFLPVVLGISVAALIVSLVAFKNDAYTSVTNAYITFMLCAPVSAFISFAYPAYLGSLRSYSHGAAILSEATPEKYEKTSVITFSDEDAFPAEKIRMKSVKVLDNNSIEKVIYYAASVYSKIGGPLATVFGAAALENATSDSVEIKELSDSGIDALVDGKHVVVGQPEYMENQCFETIKEDSDDEYGGKTNKRILYLACDEVIIAKFYIQYNTSPDFIYIVKHLHEDGICVAINTIDPCIDGDLLYKNRLDPEQYAIKVIKGSTEEENDNVVSARDGGIVTTGSLKGMIKTLLLCDRLVSITKTNFAMKLVASVIGAVIAGLLIATGNSIGWLTVYPALYQLFWFVPMFIVSKVYVK